jgi:hypothetical protein
MMTLSATHKSRNTALMMSHSLWFLKIGRAGSFSSAVLSFVFFELLMMHAGSSSVDSLTVEVLSEMRRRLKPPLGRIFDVFDTWSPKMVLAIAETRALGFVGFTRLSRSVRRLHGSSALGQAGRFLSVWVKLSRLDRYSSPRLFAIAFGAVSSTDLLSQVVLISIVVSIVTCGRQAEA